MPQNQPIYFFLHTFLKAGRIANELKQQDVAAMIGKEQPWVSKVESGEIEIDLDSLGKWVGIYGFDISSTFLIIDTLLNCKDDFNTNVAKIFSNNIGVQLSILPERDSEWESIHWSFLNYVLEKDGLYTSKDLSSVILGALNPPQVGTSIASKKSFQKHFEKRKTWQNVRAWLYSESGNCADCGTKLDLQADHVNPLVKLGEAADTLDNLRLRCRRCNVIRRDSHKNGGLTYLSSQSALMWILLRRRPKNYKEFKSMCRSYGLTMADIRFQEAWAMAIWLNKEGKYQIDE